jgi:hypothetical protein
MSRWLWTFLALTLVGGVMILSSAVWAQAPQAQPCTRGGSQVMMGGVNIDELKCELAVVKQERAMSMERVDKLLAAATLLTNDLEAARAATKQREADLAAWFKGQFGDPKAAEATKP